MTESGPKKEDEVSPENEEVFQDSVALKISEDPLAVGRPLRYSVGEAVWVLSPEKEPAKIFRAQNGVYLVRRHTGEWEIYREEEIQKIH